MQILEISHVQVHLIYTAGAPEFKFSISLMYSSKGLVHGVNIFFKLYCMRLFYWILLLIALKSLY